MSGRFLQYLFLGPQKRGVKASVKFETPHLISRDKTFQNRHSEESAQLSSTRFFSKCGKVSSTASQDLTYIGGNFCLDKGIVLPTQDRVTKLRIAVKSLLSNRVSAREYLLVLGLMASCIEIIPYARLHMRSNQLCLLFWWKPVSGDLEALTLISPHLVEHLNWWLHEANIMKSRSSVQDQITHTVCTDASTQGWGGNLGSQIIQGTCSKEMGKWHINCLELQAVILNIQNFLPQLRNQSVLI